MNISGQQNNWPPLADDDEVYRLATRKAWVRDNPGNFTADAFMLEEGHASLSTIVYDVIPTPQQVDLIGNVNDFFGLASLNVGGIRSIAASGQPLDAIQDDVHHAYIDLPDPNTQRDDANQVAEDLLEVSNLCWKEDSKKLRKQGSLPPKRK